MSFTTTRHPASTCVFWATFPCLLRRDRFGAHALRLGSVAEFCNSPAPEFRGKTARFRAGYNLGGARHSVELAINSALAASSTSPPLHLGQAGRLIPEALHDPSGPFNNCYEESKCHAEHLVTNCAQQHRAHIFRPSIVIGPSESKLPVAAARVYGFIRDDRWPARSRIGPARSPGCGAQHPVNIIPVDYLVRTSLLSFTQLRRSDHSLDRLRHAHSRLRAHVTRPRLRSWSWAGESGFLRWNSYSTSAWSLWRLPQREKICSPRS